MPQWARNRVKFHGNFQRSTRCGNHREWRLKCTRIFVIRKWTHTEYRRIFLELKLSPGNDDRMTGERGLMHFEAAFLLVAKVSAVFRLSTMHEYIGRVRCSMRLRISSPKKNYIHFELAIKSCWSGTRFVWQLWSRLPPHQYPIHFMPMHRNYLRSIRVARNRPSRI